MSESQFSDRPFVAGSLIGVRAFDVDALGRLNSPSYGHIFKPGPNTAKCGGDDDGSPASAMARVQRQLSASLSRSLRQQSLAYYPSGMWSSSIEYGSRPPASQQAEEEAEKVTAHTVAGLECSCGFYAYFDGGNDYKTRDRVTAVVEGTGTCTVGSRGFRAERVELIGLVDESQVEAVDASRLDRAADWCHHHNWTTWAASALAGFGFVGGVNVIAQAFAWSPWALTGLLLVVLTFLPLFLCWRGINVHYDESLSRETPRDTSVDWDLVRRNYPDVPVYPTLDAALAEHPLTPPAPEVITPETHDDFWTRSAR